MAYKAVYNGNSLYHFNPNHDPKTGQFTFNRGNLINESGRLTDTGKQLFGFNKLNRSRINNISAKQAQKDANKEIAKLGQHNENFKNLLFGTLKETTEMASNRYWNDIKKANENEEFVKDFKNEVRKYFDAVNNGYGDDRSFRFIDNGIDTLSKKYPQFKELLEGFAPYQYFDNYDENEWNKYAKSKYREEKGTYKVSKGLGKWETKNYTDVHDPISDMINYDHYYEPRTYTVSKQTAMDVIDAVDKEYTNYFIDKYGKKNFHENGLNTYNIKEGM